MLQKKIVSIIGTVGVPAQYGGFETLVENIIGDNCSPGIQYIIYCSKKFYTIKKESYKGAILRYVNLNANGIQSIVYDIISLIKASRNSDTILVLGVSGCCFLPLYRVFSKKKLVINIDGLEHKREKWNKYIRFFLKFSERMAIKYGDTIITDNKGIQDYVLKEYNKRSELIAYGGDHVLQESDKNFESSILKKYDLIPNNYSLSICRIEPENNIHITLEAFKKNKKNLVFIGNWNKNEYGKQLLKQYKQCNNILMLAPIYDSKILNAFRNNCSNYIHGHSAGGTNPSLVEAMFYAKPILAYDVIYNRETTHNKALYYNNDVTLNICLSQIKDSNIMGQNLLEIAKNEYKWDFIAKQYEKLY